MQAAPVITPVILCGGSGTRLWPLSREGYPKQFLSLAGETSMLQQTLTRAMQIPGIGRPILISNHNHRFMVAQQARDSGCEQVQVVLEPHARSTGPAAAVSALLAMANGDDPLLLVLPSDQLISNVPAFVEAVLSGVTAATDGAIITFGIVPTEPATGYGYIKARVSDGLAAVEVERFVEKPTKEKAVQYLAEENYFWNSGIFLFRASAYLAELEKFAPDIAEAAREAVTRGEKDLDFFRLDPSAFAACPSNSIDYAIMEHTKAARMVKMAADWSDLGSWDSVWQVGLKTADGNVVTGDVLAHNASDCLVHASHRLVAIAGLENVVVVETPDAVLVMHKDKTQEVKTLVDQVRGRGRSEAIEHRKVYRPWGTYDSVDNGNRYQVKRITVKPGAKLSLQMHHHRAEHWIVVSGTAMIRRGDDRFLLSENQSTFIPIGEIHSLENPGKIPLELIEVQSGPYLGEDDIIRLEDSYGRV